MGDKGLRERLARHLFVRSYIYGAWLDQEPGTRNSFYLKADELLAEHARWLSENGLEITKKRRGPFPLAIVYGPDEKLWIAEMITARNYIEGPFDQMGAASERHKALVAAQKG